MGTPRGQGYSREDQHCVANLFPTNSCGNRGCQRSEAFMLTNAQIAILCDIGQASSFDGDKKVEVASLINRGYVEKAGIFSKLRQRAKKS
jgi:hypothetical protein